MTRSRKSWSACQWHRQWDVLAFAVCVCQGLLASRAECPRQCLPLSNVKSKKTLLWQQTTILNQTHCLKTVIFRSGTCRNGKTQEVLIGPRQWHRQWKPHSRPRSLSVCQRLLPFPAERPKYCLLLNKVMRERENLLLQKTNIEQKTWFKNL